MEPPVMGNKETDEQYLNNEDRELVYAAVSVVLVDVRAEIFLPRIINIEKHLRGAYVEDEHRPHDFDYTIVALEAYKELLKLRTNVRNLSWQREQTFLVNFITKKRMS